MGLFAANNPKHTEGFGPKVDGFDQVPFADHEAIKKAINKIQQRLWSRQFWGKEESKLYQIFV